jgi:hypothetical protein
LGGRAGYTLQAFGPRKGRAPKGFPLLSLPQSNIVVLNKLYQQNFYTFLQ